MKNLVSPSDPVLRIPDLAIDAEALVKRGLEKYEAFEADRLNFIRRREEFYLGWDDYITPVRKGLYEGSSNFHLPNTEIKVHAMHARLLKAIFGFNDSFFIDTQDDVDIHRIKNAKLMMKYILHRYANYNNGIFSAIDDFAWDLSADGMGILARGWEVEQRWYLDILRNEDFDALRVDLDKMLQGELTESDFNELLTSVSAKPFKEELKVRTIFNGPTVIAKDPMLVLFKGNVVDSMDLDLHETVIEVCYFSRNQLLQFKDSEYMDEKVIEELLDRPADTFGSTTGTMRLSSMQYSKDQIRGVQTVNSNLREESYEFLKVYDKVSLARKNKYGIADRIVYYIPTATQKLARWTYLDRISQNGKIPLHMAHLYRRPRSSIGRGIVETQFSLNEMADILVNQSIDAGIYANSPMGAYRGDSGFDPQEVRVKPGHLVRTDDPNNDLRFFDWKTQPLWSTPLQGLISSLGDQLVSIGPMSTGQVGGSVGPLRSTSGVRELSGLQDLQHDVIFRRVGQAISGLYEGLYMDCVVRMPDRLKISVLGPSGRPVLDEDGAIIKLDIDREDLQFRIHFGIYANSALVNQSQMRDNAAAIFQMLVNRLMLETGIVTPEKLHKIATYFIESLGIQFPDEFINEPKEMAIPIAAELSMIMQGIMPPIVMADPEHEEKISKYTDILNSDKAAQEIEFGHVHQNAIKLLQKAIKDHTTKFEVMQQAQRDAQMQQPGGGASIGIGNSGGRPAEGVVAPSEVSSPEQAPVGIEGVGTQALGG